MNDLDKRGWRIRPLLSLGGSGMERSGFGNDGMDMMDVWELTSRSLGMHGVTMMAGRDRADVGLLGSSSAAPPLISHAASESRTEWTSRPHIASCSMFELPSSPPASSFPPLTRDIMKCRTTASLRMLSRPSHREHDRIVCRVSRRNASSGNDRCIHSLCASGLAISPTGGSQTLANDCGIEVR